MKIWKKNLVAFAILLTVCGGIYANWQYSQKETAVSLTDTLNEEKILSSDTLVMAEDLTNTSSSTASDYFAAVRLSRQEARDSAVSLLQETMAYDDKDTVTSSDEQLGDIVQTALCEAQIESLIIAKGYRDCVTYISDQGISVAVATPENGLEQEDVAVIADIVINQTDFTMDDIRVVEVQ